MTKILLCLFTFAFSLLLITSCPKQIDYSVSMKYSNGNYEIQLNKAALNNLDLDILRYESEIVLYDSRDPDYTIAEYYAKFGIGNPTSISEENNLYLITIPGQKPRNSNKNELTLLFFYRPRFVGFYLGMTKIDAWDSMGKFGGF